MFQYKKPGAINPLRDALAAAVTGGGAGGAGGDAGEVT